MIPMGEFLIDLKTGEIGENVVLKILQKESNVEDVIDVRDNKLFQKYDVDFLVYTDRSIIVPIEVKSDTMAHRTKNIAYEVLSNKHYNTKGCFEKTRARYIYYYLTKTKQLYQIDVIKLRSHVKNNYKNNKKLIPMGDNALGYLIKINELLNCNIMKELMT